MSSEAARYERISAHVQRYAGTPVEKDAYLRRCPENRRPAHGVLVEDTARRDSDTLPETSAPPVHSPQQHDTSTDTENGMATIDLGFRLTSNLDRKTDVAVQAYTAMFSRHGLIAGATGTGKTKTLQLITEQLSEQGVPVLLADLKGDFDALDGVVPTRRISLTGKTGMPLRIPVESFGVPLLAKLLDLSPTQESVLEAMWLFFEDNGVVVETMHDFVTQVRWFMGNDGRTALKYYGGGSPQSLSVILRKLMQFRREPMFGDAEDAFDIDRLYDTEEGNGVVTILDLTDVGQDKRDLFAAAMMWLLAEVYKRSPEVGETVKPRLCFFFDEAHLLFRDASKALVSQVETTVRMSRSKGLGVFFVTQSPADLPEAILAQLGNRIQHALRAFTPKDAKGVRDTAKTFPASSVYDVHAALTTLPTACCLVSVLGPGGAPDGTYAVRVNAPKSLNDKGVADLPTA